jgi:hypothetical protein
MHDPAAFAQGASEGAAPAKYPKVLSKNTTTSPDGLTTTTTTRAMGNYGGDIVTTVVTTTDKDHIIQSEVSTTSDRNGLSSSTLTTDTKKYNLLGGYAETIDVTDTWRASYDSRQPVYTDHQELQRDAAGNILSGTRVHGGTSLIDKGPERAPLTSQKYTWDATAKTWTSGEGTSWTPVQPDTSTASNATEQVIAPPVSSPGKQMMVAYRDPETLAAGASLTEPLVKLALRLSSVGPRVTANDHAVYAQVAARDLGYDWKYVVVDVPADAVSVSVFKGFDGNGNPDAHASVTNVSSDAPVPGMTNLPSTPVPAGQPAIVASSGAYDVRAGTITVQTQNTSVADALVLDAGGRLMTLAASDRSIIAALPSNIALGRHELTLERLLAPQSAYPETVPFDAISLVVDPMPAVENVGDTATPTVHVMGMPAGDSAVMEFAIGGSAELAGGGTFTSVPVVGNVASCTIVGVRSGEALVRFHLRVVSLAGTTQ